MNTVVGSPALALRAPAASAAPRAAQTMRMFVTPTLPFPTALRGKYAFTVVGLGKVEPPRFAELEQAERCAEAMRRCGMPEAHVVIRSAAAAGGAT